MCLRDGSTTLLRYLGAVIASMMDTRLERSTATLAGVVHAKIIVYVLLLILFTLRILTYCLQILPNMMALH